MKKLRIILVGALLALPMLGATAPAAHACNDTTDLDVCGRINNVCQKVGKANCVG